jgi:hypothetical protein
LGTAGADEKLCATGRMLLIFGGSRRLMPPRLGLWGSNGGPEDSDPPNVGRIGGVPCLDKWNAFILASMLSGRPLAVLDCTRGGGAPGLRALFNMPRGVEDAVIDAVAESDWPLNEGSRGGFVDSSEGLVAGDPSSELVDSRPGAKSWESSGALGTVLGGVAILFQYSTFVVIGGIRQIVGKVAADVEQRFCRALSEPHLADTSSECEWPTCVD